MEGFKELLSLSKSIIISNVNALAEMTIRADINEVLFDEDKIYIYGENSFEFIIDQNAEIEYDELSDSWSFEDYCIIL